MDDEKEPEMPMEHDEDADMDDELNHMAAGEAFDGMDKKDKKGFVDSIRAIVMNCGGKV